MSRVTLEDLSSNLFKIYKDKAGTGAIIVYHEFYTDPNQLPPGFLLLEVGLRRCDCGRFRLEKTVCTI